MITEHDLSTLLDRATTHVDPAPLPVERLVDDGRRARRHRAQGSAAACVAAVVAAGALAVTTPWSSPPAPTPLAGTGDCRTTIPRRVLPVWARAGFSGRHPKLAYVVGRERRFAALVFGQTLTAPPPTDGRNNKILWVLDPTPGAAASRPQGRDLVIHAHLMGGSASVVRTVPGGPGPSTIDLPAAGCWRLDLTWAGLTDSLDLYYAAG